MRDLVALFMSLAWILAACGGQTGLVAQELRPGLVKKTAADFSEPKKTFETYLRAIKANDVELAKQCYYMPGKGAAEVLDVVVGIWVTAHELEQVATAKFGKPGLAVLHEAAENSFRSSCSDKAIDRTLAKLRDAKVETKGEWAKLFIPWGEHDIFSEPVFGYTGQEPAAELRKTKIGWKISQKEWIADDVGKEFFKPGSWDVMFRDRLAIDRRIATEMKKGTFRTEEDVIAATEKESADLAEKYDPGRRNRMAKARASGPSGASIPTSTRVDFSAVEAYPDVTGHPVMAVSESGVVYIFCRIKPVNKMALCSEVPLISPNLAPVPEKDADATTCLVVNRHGQWSKAGYLIGDLRYGVPNYAWCEDEKLHLLLCGKGTNHLVYDPQTRVWSRVAEIPMPSACGDRGAFCHTGKELHVAWPQNKSLFYCRFDGHGWNVPMRIDQIDKATGTVCRARLTLDFHGHVHLVWSTDTASHLFYAVLVAGKVHAEQVDSREPAIPDDDFDLGTDPKGRVVLAYAPALPDKDGKAKRLHVRYREENRWSNPERLGGGNMGGGISNIHVLWNEKRLLATWVQSEHHEDSGLGGGFRRYVTTDGRSWSPVSWLARRPTLRLNGEAVNAMDVALCVSSSGDAHAFWLPESCYCLFARLGK